MDVVRFLEEQKVPHTLRVLDVYDAVDEEFAGSKVIVYPRYRKLDLRNADLIVIRGWMKQLLTVRFCAFEEVI